MSVTTFGYKQLHLCNGPHRPLPAKNLNIEGIRMMGTASSLYQQNRLGLKDGSKVIKAKALQKWIKTQWTWNRSWNFHKFTWMILNECIWDHYRTTLSAVVPGSASLILCKKADGPTRHKMLQRVRFQNLLAWGVVQRYLLFGELPVPDSIRWNTQSKEATSL